jgi:hypothetical protein
MSLITNGIAGHKNNGEREKDDFYPTPPHATQALLDMVKFEGDVWECACGDGAISKVLEQNGFKVYSSDLFDRGYGDVGVDFLSTYKKVDNIITNPPYKLAQEFVEHALKNADKKVAMLLKLNFLEGVKRYNMFKSTPLKHVLVFSKRLTFYEGTLEKTKRSGVLAYAWYVWEKSYEGKPYIDWIL